MYKVLLADDEKWALLGLTRLVHWEDYQCEIVGTANDGISALEQCRSLKPDVLITDIRMPGMDGLELARVLAMELPEITVILVTGYSDIAYAQTALRIGVFDYLTKQITSADMDAMLRRFLASVSQRALRSTSQFFFSFFGEENARSIGACLSDLCIPHGYGCVRAATLLYDQPVRFACSQIQEDGHGMKIVFHTGSHQLTCLCLWDGQPAEDAWYGSLPSLPAAAQVGLSPCASLEAPFYETYRQSVVAAETARFWHSAQPVIYQAVAPETIQAAVQPLRRRLASGGMPLAQGLHALRVQAQGMMVDGLETLMNQCIALFSAFHVPGWELSSPLDFQQIVTNGGCCEELFAVLDTLLQGQEKQTAPQLVDQVMAYVERNFRQDLRITQLADMFHINASYLSTLIRKNTGETYSDIVTGKRLDYAKELLRTTQLTTQEIAFQCGYHEYSHFNSLFKKKVGTTPAQYRLHHI